MYQIARIVIPVYGDAIRDKATFNNVGIEGFRASRDGIHFDIVDKPIPCGAAIVLAHGHAAICGRIVEVNNLFFVSEIRCPITVTISFKGDEGAGIRRVGHIAHGKIAASITIMFRTGPKLQKQSVGGGCKLGKHHNVGSGTSKCQIMRAAMGILYIIANVRIARKSGPIGKGGCILKIVGVRNCRWRGDIDLDVGTEIIMRPSHISIVYIGKVKVTATIECHTRIYIFFGVRFGVRIGVRIIEHIAVTTHEIGNRGVKAYQQVAVAIVVERCVKVDGHPTGSRSREGAFKHFVAWTDHNHVATVVELCRGDMLHIHLDIRHGKRSTAVGIIEGDCVNGTTHSHFIGSENLLGQEVIPIRFDWERVLTGVDTRPNRHDFGSCLAKAGEEEQ